MFDRFRSWYRSLPEKKQYIEFLTAALSVPVLITVIISNVNNLAKLKEKPASTTTTSSSKQDKIIIITQKEQAKQEEANNKPTTNPTLTPAPTNTQCIKEVGPVKISRPQEEEIIAKEPFCLDLSYSDDRYCSVVVSSRLDGGSWSSFASDKLCFQNLSVGKHVLELRAKSVASNDEVTLGRTFYFQAKEAPTVTPTTVPTVEPTSSSLQ